MTEKHGKLFVEDEHFGRPLAVHDRPCGECRHHLRIGPTGFGGSSICRRHHMAVTPNMLVSYHVEPDPLRGLPGLCFEAVAEIDDRCRCKANFAAGAMDLSECPVHE
ncbi:MAG: hypothetical protein JWR77_2349 [Rhizorhabdus sp.]|nr:hypothetical protein [Rhizorhabdus sp.]